MCACMHVCMYRVGWNYVWASSHAAIYDTWPLYGIAMSLLITTLCLLAIPFGRRQDWSVHKTRVTLCMVLLSICIRHYEENIFDLLQRENSFITYVNNMFDAWVPAFHCSDFEVRLVRMVVCAYVPICSLMLL